MKILHAFSTDLNQDITATKADSLFPEKIKSPQNFVCIDEVCRAPITCVNLANPAEKRKRVLHFKLSSELRPHTKDCCVQKDIDGQSKKISRNTNNHHNTNEDKEFIFHILPDDTKNKPEQYSNNNLGSSHLIKETSIKKTSTHQGYLEEVIDIFHNNPNQQILIKVEKKLFNIQELLTHIPNFQGDKQWHIYHGKGWINKKEDKYYIKFIENVLYHNLQYTASFFIMKNFILQLTSKNTIQKRLEKLSNISKPYQIFILTNNFKENKNFINLDFKGMRYCAFIEI
ncbi:hypothetical protein [Commensalibacter nepenthis]|uniref:Uncharacterized protein n=1 Tax=Commensalibacter nepenthis TaxID=3043872 RepID=A0ABT6QBE0_9PROT|nr:hypothetical protein [Commensalibacter sp. TBRC 10068]MDI2113625.1 hypothetical protein [Commensalibacter sp. TBRC 10068]